MVDKIHRPVAGEVQNPELRKQLFETGPVDVPSLEIAVAQAARLQEKAAEAIARFALANFLDGNVPGSPKIDHRAAVAELTKAIELYDRWPEAYFNRGIARVHTGDYDGAIMDFDLAEKLFRSGAIGSSSFAASRDRLLLGKLSLFRAEARSKRRKPGDVEQARDDLNQAQSLLLLCGSDARFWLEQIPERRAALSEAMPPSDSTDQPTRKYGFGSGFAGTALLLIVLLFLVVCNTQPKEKSPEKAPSPKPSASSSGSKDTSHVGLRDSIPKPSASSAEPKGNSQPAPRDRTAK
jgi:tetratricopeptide (TPR) repeat protein